MCVFATGIPWDLWGSGGILVSVGILELFWAQQAISATGIPWDLWRSGGKCREELPLQTIKEQNIQTQDKKEIRLLL